MNAYLNWGRWVVRCPNPSCVGASRLEPGQPSIVCVCQDVDLCQHGPMCATPYRVEWPADHERIMEVVAVRPVAHRHWYPGETVDDLLRENEEHASELAEAAG